MTITTESIVYLAGVIVTVGAAIKLMYEFKKKMDEPYQKIQDRLDHHDKCLERDKNAIEKLQGEQDQIIEDNRQILLVLSTMLSHMETGNNTGQVRATRDDLDRYLINRK